MVRSQRHYITLEQQVLGDGSCLLIPTHGQPSIALVRVLAKRSILPLLVPHTTSSLVLLLAKQTRLHTLVLLIAFVTDDDDKDDSTQR